MANWLNEIDVCKEWDAADEDKAHLPALIKKVIAELESLKPFRDPYIEEEKAMLIIQFEGIVDDDVEEFDAVWSELYDWADQQIGNGKVCWVRTL